MTLFILSIFVAIVSVVAALVMKRAAFLSGLLIAIVLSVCSVFAVVPTGQTGILITMGKVADYTLDAGMNVVLPWQSVVLMDNREQKIVFKQQAFSSDIQQVELRGSVVYSIDKSTAMDLYRSVGTNYAEIVIHPQIAEDVKAVISRYTAEGLIGQRATVSAEILKVLREDLSAHGLNIVSVAIENIDFSDAFEQAVEAKQVATQTKQRAQTEQEQQTMEAQQSAERQRIQAQADADVARIQAEAAQYAGEREAEMNRKLSESLTPELVQYYYAQRWDGKLPTTMMGGNGMVLPMLPVEENQ